MSKIVLAFTKLHPLIPIRRGVLVHGDLIIESSAFGPNKGVRPRNLYEYIDTQPKLILRQFAHPKSELVWELCQSQIGKPYDFGWYIAALTGNRDWQSDEAWVCHELIAWACAKAGTPIPGCDWDKARLVPQNLFDAMEAV